MKMKIIIDSFKMKTSDYKMRTLVHKTITRLNPGSKSAMIKQK